MCVVHSKGKLATSYITIETFSKSEREEEEAKIKIKIKGEKECGWRV
jgi:hypothetical protein